MNVLPWIVIGEKKVGAAVVARHAAHNSYSVYLPESSCVVRQ